MRLKAPLYLTVAAIGIASVLAAAPAQLRAQTAVAIDNDDIGGVVTGANGPEAGVWVIAETTDLPTRYAKIVVTDDQGRYVLPDLPKAKYKVWVRGYGLVDSPKVDGGLGAQLRRRGRQHGGDTDCRDGQIQRGFESHGCAPRACHSCVVARVRHVRSAHARALRQDSAQSVSSPQ